MEPNQQPVEPTPGSARAPSSTGDVESQLGRVEAAVDHAGARRPTATLAAPVARNTGPARAPRHQMAGPREVDAALDGVENRMDRQLRQQAAVSRADANGARARAEHRTMPGARPSTRPLTSVRENSADVESWLSVPEPRALTAARPTPPEGLRASEETAAATLSPDPWLSDDAVDTPPSSGAESWLTGLKSDAPAVVRAGRSANGSAQEMRQELDALPMPDERPGSNGADSVVRAGLGEMMRRLDGFYSGLVTMERRLDTSDESYSKVTDRWQPSQDTPSELDEESDAEQPVGASRATQ